jgi:hypothetical protein
MKDRSAGLAAPPGAAGPLPATPKPVGAGLVAGGLAAPPARGKTLGTAWRLRTESGWPCGCTHGPVPGRLDETARRLSHEELAVATVLAREGHAVRSLRESRGGGRKADLEVCGAAVEVKSWLPAGERGRAPTARSVLNKLIDASGQAGMVVLNAEGSGLPAGAARRGVALFAERRTRADGALRAVRVMGDGFDLTWSFRPVREIRSPVREAAGRARPVVLGS